MKNNFGNIFNRLKRYPLWGNMENEQNPGIIFRDARLARFKFPEPAESTNVAMKYESDIQATARNL